MTGVWESRDRGTADPAHPRPGPPRTLEDLSRDACLSLLATGVVGRLGIIDGTGPLVVPVNYLLDGLTVVFRTAPGTKHNARWLMPACFEVDHLDRTHRLGWSVLARGLLQEITEHDEQLSVPVQRLRLDPWASGPKDHWMRLLIEEVTGRRLVPADHDPSTAAQLGERTHRSGLGSATDRAGGSG